MTKTIAAFSALCLTLALLAGPPATAAEGNLVIAANVAVAPLADEVKRAQALLDRAAAHYQANGKNALAAFSRIGDFVDGDLYVYAIGNDGTMIASGGPSITLVGRDVRNLKDAAGKPFFAEMIENARQKGGGAVEYRWLNREHGKVERKVAHYRQVGDAIIAVGYYIPRGAAEEGKALLQRAVVATTRDPVAAIASFNDMNGGFVEDDLYVFVVGLKDKVMHAHGAMPRLVGRDTGELRDVNGKPIIRQMIDIVNAKGAGELQYVWPNPVTRKQEKKTTYLQRVDGYLVAVGHYGQ